MQEVASLGKDPTAQASKHQQTKLDALIGTCSYVCYICVEYDMIVQGATGGPKPGQRLAPSSTQPTKPLAVKLAVSMHQWHAAPFPPTRIAHKQRALNSAMACSASMCHGWPFNRSTAPTHTDVHLHHRPATWLPALLILPADSTTAWFVLLH